MKINAAIPFKKYFIAKKLVAILMPGGLKRYASFHHDLTCIAKTADGRHAIAVGISKT
jgi:hypothetical protein